MKKSNAILLITIILCLLLCACSTMNSSQVVEVQNDPVIAARENVISKWKNEAGVLGTARYIEDTYKQYPDDDVISNIYFYCIAKEEYDHYLSLSDNEYLDSAKEYASNIDPEYSGELSTEIQSFAQELLANEDRTKIHEGAKTSTDAYNSLTNSQKKEICNFIQSRYDHYDSIAGGYAGDKYTDTIWQETMQKYGLTKSQVDIIWMNSYTY